MDCQRTVAANMKIVGTGVHKGEKVTLTVRPAPENHGIVFKRIDLEGDNLIPALYDHVIDTTMCTVIGNKSGAKVATIEHLMSALWGCGIDNALIEVDNEEVPILDGSSGEFVMHLNKVGSVLQNAQRQYIYITERMEVADGDKTAILEPADCFEVDFSIDFPSQAIGKQARYFSEAKHKFSSCISKARTFGFMHEIEYLKGLGLALGASLKNAIGIDKDTILNPEGLRYDDEFVRHKILDCIGDLYLAGYRIKGKVSAFKSGHKLNNKILHELFSNTQVFCIMGVHPQKVVNG
jgi:UDP-3-O-[3-hydroxymyristoyl] N-acetylglucosamine deacetylase